MEQRKIVVVECVSSSVNYIEDIRKEGFEPILLELRVPEKNQAQARWLHDYFLSAFEVDPPRIIAEEASYEKTLQVVASLAPLLVLPGGDDGIYLAMKLSNDLGLKGNPFSLFPVMRRKDLQQRALSNAGLRSIEGRMVSDAEEALAFYEELQSDAVVCKPAIGEASVGVVICRSASELESAVHMDLVAAAQAYPDNPRVLLQEFIDGTEYIVDTVSCPGCCEVMLVSSCEKAIVPGAAPIYERICYNLTDNDAGKAAARYVLEVVQALGIQYGPVHCEVKVDEKGPVLIEANCRLDGAMMRANWLDSFLSHHESDLALKSYLHPDKLAQGDGGYALVTGSAMIYFLSTRKDVYVRENRVQHAFCNLPSFAYALPMGNDRLYRRTIDLSTCCAMVYLAHRNPAIVEQDADVIRQTMIDSPEKVLVS